MFNLQRKKYDFSPAEILTNNISLSSTLISFHKSHHTYNKSNSINYRNFDQRAFLKNNAYKMKHLHYKPAFRSPNFAGAQRHLLVCANSSRCAREGERRWRLHLFRLWRPPLPRGHAWRPSGITRSEERFQLRARAPLCTRDDVFRAARMLTTGPFLEIRQGSTTLSPLWTA